MKGTGFRPVVVIVTSLGLALLTWIGAFSAGVPTLHSPLPLLTVLPALALSAWHLEYLAILVPSVLFFLWTPGVRKNSWPDIPKRTIVLLSLLTVLTVVYFVAGWSDGIRYQGLRHTKVVCIISVAWLVALWLVVVRCWSQPSVTGNLILHWLLFAWLGWYAFPYLGELP